MKLILQAIKSLLRKVEKRFDATIPAPTGATVGQTIVVKAVDENGKPTEWEAVDMPEQANADWEKNDETAADYVKNRTHHDRTEVPILENVELTFIWSEMATHIYSYGNPVTFVVGHEYRIVTDTYGETFAYPESETRLRFVFDQGNKGEITPTEFAFLSGSAHTLSLYEITEGVKQLDEKYIPDTIARTAAIPSDAHINTLIDTKLGVIENGYY